MKIQDTVAVVTGANRGLGLALTRALFDRGARRVYAATRKVADVTAAFAGEPRVVPVEVDVTDPAQAAALADRAADATLLVNNAGTLASFDVLTADDAALRRDLEVNYLAPLELARRFAPALARDGGAIVNVLSVVSLAAMPGLGGYSASKAAAWSLTQALRGALAPRGVTVHAVFPGPIDTDMIRGFDLPKTGPAEVARAILDGVEAGADDIFPDPMSAQIGDAWRGDPKAIERQFSAM